MAGAVTFLQTANDTTDATTYTFSAQNLGTAAADRYIIVTAHGRDTGSGAKTLSTLTVGGVSATIVVQLRDGGTNSSLQAIAIAHVPTETSGDVVVTWSEAFVRCNIGMFRAVGIDADAVDFLSSGVDDPTVGLDVPAEGIAVACSTNGTTNTCTWTGITERYDAQSESGSSYSGACDDYASEQVNLTMTATWLGANTECGGVFASWGPAAAAGGGTSGNLLLLGVG